MYITTSNAVDFIWFHSKGGRAGRQHTLSISMRRRRQLTVSFEIYYYYYHSAKVTAALSYTLFFSPHVDYAEKMCNIDISRHFSRKKFYFDFIHIFIASTQGFY